jgi:hypothetical protein
MSFYRYLKFYPKYSIVLDQNPSQSLTLFSDASHADYRKRRSTESYVFMLGSTPISWSSKRQQIVAPSSTVAEYCAPNSAIHRGLYLRSVCPALDFRLMGPPRIPLVVTMR